MKAKHLHRHRVWTNLWHIDREAVLRVWSRTNLEGRSETWHPKNILPSMFVSGDMAMLLTVEKVWSDALQALWEGVVWRR